MDVSAWVADITRQFPIAGLVLLVVWSVYSHANRVRDQELEGVRKDHATTLDLCQRGYEARLADKVEQVRQLERQVRRLEAELKKLRDKE